LSETHVRREPDRRARKRRSDGERSRNAILREAAQLATVEGLDGLSISRLAEAVGMSKSGLFAHFGSKEELQLATIETATALFTEQVIEPASVAPTGLERLRQLAEGFLRHVEADVFPGGCFFASVAAEMDTHPGPVRDLAVQVVDEWHRRLVTAVRDAQGEGAIDPSEDPEQLAFELNAYLLLGNAQFVISRKSTPIDRARRALERRLTAAAPAA
jgi:AcrR family transcriptional regulator